MKVTFSLYDNFHGISHVMGVKVIPVGACSSCKSMSRHIEFRDTDEIDHKDLADALIRLAESIGGLKFDD